MSSALQIYGPLVSAVFFIASALCWFRGAAIKHPDTIDLGGFDDDGKDVKDWFWAYKKAGRWARRAALCAGIGALIFGVVEINKFLGQ